MSAVHIVERPAQYPGVTVWGSPAGPCAYMGEIVRGQGLAAGVSVYVNEREFNELRAAFGCPTREDHEVLSQAFEAAKERIAELEQQLADTEEIRVVPISDVHAVVDQRLEDLAALASPKESHASR